MLNIQRQQQDVLLSMDKTQSRAVSTVFFYLLFWIYQWGQTVTGRTSMLVAQQHSSFAFLQNNQWGFTTQHTRTMEWHSHTTSSTFGVSLQRRMQWESSHSKMLLPQVLEHCDTLHSTRRRKIRKSPLHQPAAPALTVSYNQNQYVLTYQYFWQH